MIFILKHEKLRRLNRWRLWVIDREFKRLANSSLFSALEIFTFDIENELLDDTLDNRRTLGIRTADKNVGPVFSF